MFRFTLLLLAVFQKCTAIIYQLNDTEYARMPPLYGLDEYADCLLPDDGTYCVARFDLHADPDNQLMRIIREYSEASVKHYNHTYIERGICVTKTCRSFRNEDETLIEKEGNVTDLGPTLEACLNASVWREYGLETKLSAVYYCDKHGDQKNIEIRDWIVVGLFIAILLLNLVGSCYDVYVCKTAPEGKGNKILLSFSVPRNWEWLISGESAEPRLQRLKGLHAIRVLTIIMMPLPHVMFINTTPFTENPRDYELNADTTFYQLLNNGLMVIQTFFVLSGFLLVYNLQVRTEKRQITWGLALKIWILRWFRLTPAYAALIAFTATWYRHMGSGPVWNYFITNAVSEHCTTYWWQHLLFIQNYMPGRNECAIQSWHIAVDTQLFTVGLIVYLLTRVRARTTLLGVLLALGVVLPALHVWLYDMDALVLIRPEFFRTLVYDTFFHLHVYGHTNLAAYVIGMGAGYLVYHLQKKKVDLSNNKVCYHLAWWIIPAIFGLFFVGNVFYIDGPPAPLAARMAYAGLHRAVIGGIVAFGVFLLAMGINHPLRRAFEWPVWVIPSRLAFSVYLVHFNFIFAYIGIKAQPNLVSTYYVIVTHFGVLGLSFLLGLPFYLIFEGPFSRMIKTLVVAQKENNTSKDVS